MDFPTQRATDRRAAAPGGTDLYDMRDHHQFTANEPDAKAILPEARSVQKAISYQ